MRRASKAKLFLATVILSLVAASVVYLAGSPVHKTRQSPVKEVKLDQAEVVIDGFHFAKSDTDKGGWVLDAKKAEVTKETGKAKLRDLQGRYSGKDGMVLTMNADEGMFDTGTKAISLTGRANDVTVKSSNGYSMSARELSWDDVKKELTTDNKVVIKGDNIKIEGKGLVARSDLQEVRITNGVRTEFTHTR